MGTEAREYYSTKEADFYSDRIVLKRKKGNIVILRSEIYKIFYVDTTVYSWFHFLSVNLWAFPFQFVIYLKPGMRKGRKKRYSVHLKYSEFLQVPFVLREMTRIC